MPEREDPALQLKKKTSYLLSPLERKRRWF